MLPVSGLGKTNYRSEHPNLHINPHPCDLLEMIDHCSYPKYMGNIPYYPFTGIKRQLLTSIPCSKEFNLAQREVLPLPSAPGTQALSPWNVLSGKSIFVYLRTLDQARYSSTEIYSRAFGSCGISSTSKGAGD